MNTETLSVILAYIDTHINDKITLLELSEIAGYSPFYFSKLFSEAMGMPVTGYIRIRKLQYALVSLLEGRKILDVSLMYAFDSHEGFTRSFTQMFDTTPSKAKKYLLEDGSVKIADNGRGIPLSQDTKVSQQVLDKILAGRPITNLEYAQMGDFAHCGLQTVNSLCELLQVKVYREGMCYQQDYVRGIAHHDVTCMELEHASGMEMVLKPDRAIFGNTKFEVDIIKKWVAENTHEWKEIKWSFR